MDKLETLKIIEEKIKQAIDSGNYYPEVIFTQDELILIEDILLNA